VLHKYYNTSAFFNVFVALGHAALDIKDIDHILNSEHECTPLRLPSTMAVHGYLSLVY
jgi:hypothetical protein